MNPAFKKAAIYSGLALITLFGNLAALGQLPFPGIPPVYVAVLDATIATFAGTFVHAFNHPDAPAPEVDSPVVEPVAK